MDTACGRLKNVPLPNMSTSNPRSHVNGNLYGKNDSADVIRSRILRQETILGPSVITSILLRGRQESQGQRRRYNVRSRDML